MFVHLHWHSKFSMLDAIWQIWSIVSKAKSLDMNAIALTEYYSMSWAIEFYKSCQKNQIKPIIGVELGFVDDMNIAKQQKYIPNITLIAKNYEWYQNILKIVSEWYDNTYLEKPVCDFTILKKYNNWLFVLLGSEHNVIYNLSIMGESDAKILEVWNKFVDTMGKNNVIWEIIIQDYKSKPDAKKSNQKIIELTKQSDNLMIGNNNFHYINPEDKEIREVAMNIKDGKKIYDQDRRMAKWDYHIADQKYIQNIMSKNWFDENFINQMIANSQQIADNINIQIPLYQKLFPNYNSDPTISKIYEQNKNDLVMSI